MSSPMSCVFMPVPGQAVRVFFRNEPIFAVWAVHSNEYALKFLWKSGRRTKAESGRLPEKGVLRIRTQFAGEAMAARRLSIIWPKYGGMGPNGEWELSFLPIFTVHPAG